MTQESSIFKVLFLIEEDEVYLKDCVFLVLKIFKCVERSTGTAVLYEEVKILMRLLNMSVIH
jgi:hypothetical protein